MPQPKFDVVVCGSLHLDIIVETPHLPQSDETVVGRSWRPDALPVPPDSRPCRRKPGARTAMIGRVGNDDFGARLLAHLDRAGVDRRGVETDPDTGSGMSVATIDDKGDYGAVIVSGSNLGIAPAGIAAAWQRLAGGYVLVLQNEVPHAVNVAAARVAAAAGAIVVLNAAPARKNGLDLLDHIDVLVANRIEAEMISGRAIADRAAAIAALPLLGCDRRTVIVTLGAGGLVVAEPGTVPCGIAALPVTAISTHGAGDCFVGALAFRLAKGDGMVAACTFANSQAGHFVAATRAI
jgi:ribokinase